MSDIKVTQLGGEEFAGHVWVSGGVTAGATGPTPTPPHRETVSGSACPREAWATKRTGTAEIRYRNEGWWPERGDVGDGYI